MDRKSSYESPFFNFGSMFPSFWFLLMVIYGCVQHHYLALWTLGRFHIDDGHFDLSLAYPPMGLSGIQIFHYTIPLDTAAGSVIDESLSVSSKKKNVKAVLATAISRR